jgi:hypothetical protein
MEKEYISAPEKSGYKFAYWSTMKPTVENPLPFDFNAACTDKETKLYAIYNPEISVKFIDAADDGTETQLFEEKVYKGGRVYDPVE